MSIGKLINQYRAKNKMSMQEFADKAHLSKGYISMLEKGRHPQTGKEIIPSIDTVSKIAAAMGVSVDTLLASTDSNQQIRLDNNAPVYEAAAGQGIISSAPVDTISMHLRPDQSIATVRGRSMEPTLLNGDKVVIDAQSVLDYDGQIALVKVNGEENTLKRVQIKKDGLLLVGDNTSVYSPTFYTAQEVNDLPVQIMGVVSMLLREMK